MIFPFPVRLFGTTPATALIVHEKLVPVVVPGIVDSKAIAAFVPLQMVMVAGVATTLGFGLTVM